MLHRLDEINRKRREKGKPPLTRAQAQEALRRRQGGDTSDDTLMDMLIFTTLFDRSTSEPAADTHQTQAAPDYQSHNAPAYESGSSSSSSSDSGSSGGSDGGGGSD